MMQFNLPTDLSSIINVIGVGGGGSNAVNHMFRQGIKGVDFIVCNTDKQALDMSPVPLKVQLGTSLTSGLGAGMMPEVGRSAALESLEEIKKMLTGTRMVFITAGMGKGTGTGAAPVIAEAAKSMGILTVAIVTIPFQFEGSRKRMLAEAGIEELKKNADTLLVVCNERLREMYGNLTVVNAFGHADNVLSNAARSIAEIISNTLHVNVDFNDITTVMKDSGVAILGTATASGEGRAINAVEMALNSPLLNDNEIQGARYVLMNVTSGTEEITMDELGEITDYIQTAAGQAAEIVTGYGIDAELGDKVSVTIIATGFKSKELDGFDTKKAPEKKIMRLDEIKGSDNLLNTAVTKTEIVKDELEPVLKSSLDTIKEEPQEVVSMFKEEITLNDIVDPLEPTLIIREVKDEVNEIDLYNDVDDNEETVIVEETTIVPEAEIEQPIIAEVKEEIVSEIETPVVAEAIVETETILNETIVEPIAIVEESIVNEVVVDEVLIAETPIVSEVEETPVAVTDTLVTDEVVYNDIVEETAKESVFESVTEDTPVQVNEEEFVMETNEEIVSEVVETPVAETELKQDEVVFEFETAQESVIEFNSEPTVEQEITASVEEELPLVAEMKEEIVAELETEITAETVVEEIVAETQQEDLFEITSEIKQEEPVMEIKTEEVKAEANNVPVTSTVTDDEQRKKNEERIKRLKELSMKLKSPGGLKELEEEPAYVRRKVNLDNVPHSSESQVSRYTLSEGDDKKIEIKPNNSFLHDNVD
jgi:cell division protein FtsZ